MSFKDIDWRNDAEFNYYYNKYKNNVYAIAHQYVFDFEEVEDVFQDAFCKFSKLLYEIQMSEIPVTGLESEESKRKWLYETTKNTALNQWDKTRRRNAKIEIWLDNDEIHTEISEGVSDAPLEAALKNELSREVAKVLNTLKPIHRKVIILFYFERYSPAEIAKNINVPVHTVYSRLDKAHEVLRERLVSINQEYAGSGGGGYSGKKHRRS